MHAATQTPTLARVTTTTLATVATTNASTPAATTTTIVGDSADNNSVWEGASAADPPSCMDSEAWVGVLTRTQQRVIPRLCMGARPNSHVPTAYTSPVSVY